MACGAGVNEMWFVQFNCIGGGASTFSAVYFSEKAARKVYEDAVETRNACSSDNIHAIFTLIDDYGVSYCLNLVNYQFFMASNDILARANSERTKDYERAEEKYGKQKIGI